MNVPLTNWDHKKLETIPTKGGVIPKGDERIERYSEDTMMRGSPDAVIVARDEVEVAEAIAYCNKNKVPVTICGSQTSMTGASVPLEGLLISTEKLEGIVDISTGDGEPVVVSRPGTVVADLQRAVADAGLFYPVAPTSRDECRIGSNIATNATGEDSYKYGPIRIYVKSVELVLPSGEKKILKREKGEKPSWDRNRAGYFDKWKNPLDLLIGSEGTIGFVSRLTLKLLPKSLDFFSALIPMPSNMSAVRFIANAAMGNLNLTPRALEFVDGNALKVMQTADGFPSLSEDTGALIYFKQEFKDGAECENWLSKLYDAALLYADKTLCDRIIIAQASKQKEEIRLWRHHIPETENETGRKYWANGGGKVGSDWWVPVEKLEEMMTFFYATANKTGLPHIAYAHLGAGHPHTNILGRNAEEKEIALDALRACCRKAVSLGGGVAGEHGIGKIHTDLVPIQYSDKMIEQMKKWKLEYDPNWIFGRGNIWILI